MTLRLDIPPAQRPYGPNGTLIFYDGPQLLWLPVLDQHLLAIALPDDAGPWPFLVCRVHDEVVPTLTLAGLRAIVLGAEAWYLLRDYGAPELILDSLAEVPEEWRPDAS